MKILRPIATTYWYTSQPDGSLHTGITEPGQETVVSRYNEFEYGPDMLTKLEQYKDKLSRTCNYLPVFPGIFNHDGMVVLLKKEDCKGKSLYEAAEAITSL